LKIHFNIILVSTPGEKEWCRMIWNGHFCL
jgi:hypothetical protein